MNRKVILWILLWGMMTPSLNAQCNLNSCSGTNAFFGQSAGVANTTGLFNSFFGQSAGSSNTTGESNSFFGQSAGAANTTGVRNSFFGYEAGRSNTIGERNVFFGANTGRSNTSGERNAFFGQSAGFFNSTGSFNSFFGQATGFFNSTGARNSFFGADAGKLNTTGSDNSYFGQAAGQLNTTGSFNSFFGEEAGSNNTTGSSNSFFGENAGQLNTTGSFNSFFGQEAGLNNTASLNAFFGTKTGMNNTTGEANSFFGTQSGIANTIGFDNAFFGFESGLVNSNGHSNAFFGRGSGLFNDSGNQNTFIGTQAGLSNASGGQNVYVGFQAASNNQTGSGNVFLGHQAGFNELGSNKLYIANSNTASPLIYGDFAAKSATVNGFLGVGIQNPERPIHLRDQRAIFRIDRDRADPGFAVVRYDQGFQNVWKSFYFYTLGSGVNQGKFIIADWGTDVSGPDHKARLSIDNEGDIGIGPRFENLGVNPSAKLHVDGTVRFENLPSREGQSLVIDNQGNLGIAASNSAKLSEENKSMKAELNQLKAEFAAQKKKIAQLEAKLNPTTSLPSAPTPAQLFQNQPNPYDQQTKISFFLPEQVQTAILYIYDMNGRQIKEVTILKRGKAEVAFQAGSLEAGLYLYALLVDGQEVATKRMMITD